MTVILVVAAIGAVAFVVMTAGQTFDPALEPDVAPTEGGQGADPSAPADEPLPGEG